MFLLRYFLLFSVFAAQIHHMQAQLQNLALHKAAIQSTIHDVYIANMSVDGNITQLLGACSHTLWPNKFAWWQVDLNKTYGIQSIKLYHRDANSHRLNGFKIIINIRNEWQNVQPCYNDTVNGTQPSIVTVMSCKGPARYVRIYNEKSWDTFGPILELCEVQVFGCAQNKYGNECKYDCYCRQKGCFFENGTCFVPGCEAGWHGKSCNKSCNSNKFGPDCNFTCHCLKGSCNRKTGVCGEIGCKAGWKDDNCSIPCYSNQNEFGFDCNSTCHCRIGSCNVTTGVCHTPECKDGWKGDTCSAPCDKTQNKFGYSCNSTCHCGGGGSCNQTTGVCDIPGCKAGWLGNTCSIPCMDNTFGVECKSTCHCKEGSCQNTDGQCFKPGCKRGWKGNNCSIQCTDNTFGSDCKDNCYCSNGICNSINGTCIIPGCKPGYQAKTCSFHCDKDFFGSNCSSRCYCKSNTCDPISGKCNGDMCKNGWTGETCSKKCENGTFGYECGSKCHCLIGACHHEHGTCPLQGCKDGWKGTTCSERIPEEMDNTSLLVGVSVGGLGLIFMAILITICICRRRRSGKDKNNVVISEAKPDVALDHVYDELGSTENTDYSVIGTDFIRETTYVNSASDSTTLSMENIRDDIKEKIKNGILQKQHKNIPYGPLYPQSVGNVPKNKKKNRNRNVIPYDNSRVILNTLNQSQDDDYINASYINGSDKDSMYIATQGPMKNTFEDFWRMVWQTKSSVIVMLTNVIEDKQITCFEYWPVSSSVLAFREYEIVLLEEHTISEFITKKLKVKNTKTGEVRKVWHLQFTSWPRQGVPNPYQLLLLHQKYTEIMSTNPPSGPAIIHCSDGSDRSGVFIAFDTMVKCCYRNEAIDICMLVTEMRKKRMNMVTTEESYILLHKLLYESVQYQETHVTKHDFRATIQERSNIQDREYEMLVNNIPEYNHTFYKEAMLKKNRAKHRNQSILPVETYRIILNKAGAAHYINAVEVPSCRMSKQFLVTQIPFTNTVIDLWRMIFEYNSGTVVNLEDVPSFEEDLIWHPTDEKKLVLGNLLLTKTSESMTNGTRETSLKVFDKENKEEKFVKFFQYLNWRPGNVTPTPQTSFLDFIHLVLTWNKSINNAPVTVICSDGAKCCGLFCLVYSVIENLSCSDDIDIFKIARLQQIRRPQFFSVEQYHFCYNIVQEYLEKVQLYHDIE